MTGRCAGPFFICGQRLVMVGQKLQSLSWKMWLFHLNMNIKGRIWWHSVTSWVTLTASTIIFRWEFVIVFSYLMSNKGYIEKFEIFKIGKIWGPGKYFRQKCHRKLRVLFEWLRAFPIFWVFDRHCSWNIIGFMALFTFDILLKLVT